MMATGQGNPNRASALAKHGRNIKFMFFLSGQEIDNQLEIFSRVGILFNSSVLSRFERY